MSEAEHRPPSVRTLEPASVVQLVTNEIRRAILAGELHPGQKFSLRQIASQLGVSFIPVREALRQLESNGLVITQPGKSATVAPVDSNDLHGIYRLRRQIEPEIAARSCQLLDDSDFERLDRYVAMFGDEQLGIDEIYQAHHAFHVDLLSPAATAWDLRVLEGLWHAAQRYIRLAFGRLDPDPAEHHRRERAHARLLNDFRSHDPDRVERAVLDHLEQNERIAQQAIGAVAG